MKFSTEPNDATVDFASSFAQAYEAKGGDARLLFLVFARMMAEKFPRATAETLLAIEESAFEKLKPATTK